MSIARWLVPLLLMIGTALILSRAFQGQLSRGLVDLATHPDIERVLGLAGTDLRRLAELDPDNEADYRARFREIQAIRQNLAILEQSRGNLVSRFELALLAAFGIIIAVSLVIGWLDRRRQDRKLDALAGPLDELAAGSRHLSVPELGRGVFGRMAEMIRRAHALFGEQRGKLAYLENLSTWQEAARRHAHEMRTPLTSMRLETDRLQTLVDGEPDRMREHVRAFCGSMRDDIGKLASFTDAFTAFGKISKPKPAEERLDDLIEGFARTFSTYWPNLTLTVTIEARPLVLVDRAMIRQVLVNLAENSAEALADRTGHLVLRVTERQGKACVHVTDDGPGIPDDLRVFEPYVTTRSVGEGMGLGLPVSRKIMLEHDGDLVREPSDRGACFVLVLPSVVEVAA